MNGSALRRSLARLLAGAALAAGFAVFAGPPMAAAFLPVLRTAYTQFDRDHRVLELRLAERGALGAQDRVLQLVVAPARRTVVVGRTVAETNPEGRASVSVLTAWLWQPLCIALPLLLAWPARHGREWLARLAALPPLAAALALLDLPLVLRAELWQLYIQAWNPGHHPALILWADFLQHGGRLLLGVLLAAACVGLGWMAARPLVVRQAQREGS